MLNGCLMPHIHLYEVLVAYLTPAAYAAARLADPCMWRRTAPVADLVRARFEHAMRRQWRLDSGLCDALLAALDRGEYALVDCTLLAVLNGETARLSKVQLSACGYRDTLDDDMRDCILGLDNSAVTMSGERKWSADIGGFTLEMLLSPMDGNDRVPARLPFCASTYSRGRLVLRNLEAIVRRSCCITPDVFAPLVAVRPESNLRDIFAIAQTTLWLYREEGYEVVVSASASGSSSSTMTPPFDRVRLFVNPAICARYLGSYNPRACLETIECSCYKRERGTPWPDCMAKHHCNCAWHVDWCNRAEQAWSNDLAAQMATEWRALWNGELELRKHSGHEGVVKRLRFDDDDE